MTAALLHLETSSSPEQSSSALLTPVRDRLSGSFRRKVYYDYSSRQVTRETKTVDNPRRVLSTKRKEKMQELRDVYSTGVIVEHAQENQQQEGKLGLEQPLLHYIVMTFANSKYVKKVQTFVYKMELAG